jgi:hypothetical protein
MKQQQNNNPSKKPSTNPAVAIVPPLGSLSTGAGEGRKLPDEIIDYGEMEDGRRNSNSIRPFDSRRINDDDNNDNYQTKSTIRQSM